MEHLLLSQNGSPPAPKTPKYSESSKILISAMQRHRPNVIPLCKAFVSPPKQTLLTLCILTESGVECVCDNKLWEEVKRISFIQWFIVISLHIYAYSCTVRGDKMQCVASRTILAPCLL